MYRAKDEGRNRACIYTSDQETKIESRLNWERRISEALYLGRFVLHLQPIVDLRQNCIAGYEALLRMVGENEELICPSTTVT